MSNTATTAAASPTPSSPSAPFTPLLTPPLTSSDNSQSPVAASPGPIAAQSAASTHGDPDAIDVKPAKPSETSDAAADAKLVASVMSDGSPKITENGIRAAVVAIKSGKQIAQLGGYTASSLAELKAVVAKLYKNGRLDADAAAAYDDGHSDDE